MGTPAPSDWTRFDIAKSFRALRKGTEAARRKLLRKLHLRWWHASAAAMKRLLEHAGVPPDKLQPIDDIVDTCPSCRKWAKPAPDAVASVNVSESFNDVVEFDLLFYKKLIIACIICRTTRWRAARLVDSKFASDLVEAIGEMWVTSRTNERTHLGRRVFSLSA